ncbi:MAG: hypothetical protein HN405_00600 [Planctomycetes bacterium]|jgi:branched-chain amino acid aminotransferase|nr:hypothetical protein [Planctomycetota bacterium]MBT4028834.1 hypothetical protein [Planctomycetota bacterium]MBT4559606.1 hypothetical protein [Planctomycetota bacterium]MBT5100284.1 hypothetical protein [Planctomycetota bacterium]MBT7011825.1 hypothetical protein [Planctomycetota bacterium]
MTHSPHLPLFVPLTGFSAQAGLDASVGLPPTIPGVLLGEGVFETFLVRDGVPTSALRAHEERLEQSAIACGLASAARPSLADSLPALLAVLPMGSWRVRFTALRGHGADLYCYWTATPTTQPPKEVIVHIARQRHDPNDPLASAKTVSRVGSSVARKEAQELGAFEALLKTTDGDFAEGTVSNLFAVIDGKLITPPLSRGILAGTTREALLLACAEAGIPAQEAPLFEKEILAADELWLTNAIIGVLPIVAVIGLRDDFPGASGRMLAPVRDAYLQYLASLC